MPRSQDGRWTSVCKLPGCGNTFVPRKEGHEYCSQACSNKAFPGIGGRKPADGLDPMECPVCTRTFQPYRSNQVACSRKCREAIPEIREHRNKSRQADPRTRVHNRKYQLRRRYGLTPEQYEAKLADQNGVCMICGQPPNPEGVRAASRLHQDHDHATGRNRDLICLNCNRGIGYLKDNPDLLRVVAEYIERHRQAVLAEAGGQS